MHGKEGFAFSGEGEMGVVLDTHITPELKEEGYVREILSKVQNMRKKFQIEIFRKIRNEINKLKNESIALITQQPLAKTTNI